MRTSRPPPRAKRGSISSSVLVRLTAELAQYLPEAAERSGESVSNYVRVAIHERIVRDEARRRGLLGSLRATEESPK